MIPMEEVAVVAIHTVAVDTVEEKVDTKHCADSDL